MIQEVVAQGIRTLRAGREQIKNRKRKERLKKEEKKKKKREIELKNE